MSKTTTTRRAVLGAAAVLAACPTFALAANANADSGITRLWQQAEILKDRIGTDMMTLQGGVPAWMRAGGEASRLGEARYKALVSILEAEPAHGADLALMAKAARETEMVHGPHDWAKEQFMQAAAGLVG